MSTSLLGCVFFGPVVHSFHRSPTTCSCLLLSSLVYLFVKPCILFLFWPFFCLVFLSSVRLSIDLSSYPFCCPSVHSSVLFTLFNCPFFQKHFFFSVQISIFFFNYPFICLAVHLLVQSSTFSVHCSNLQSLVQLFFPWFSFPLLFSCLFLHSALWYFAQRSNLFLSS